MKKILLSAALLSVFTMPAIAVCSITGGACSDFGTNSLQDRLVPNNLQNLQRPNAFQPNIIRPYDENMINTNTNQSPSKDYNQNNQFGNPIPVNTSGE